MKNDLPFFVNGTGLGITDIVQVLAVCVAENGLLPLVAAAAIYVVEGLHGWIDLIVRQMAFAIVKQRNGSIASNASTIS
jgi:hypothetical protein